MLNGILNGAYKKEKVFCIGLNKTGTTSLEKALGELGYKMGDQTTGELLLPEYARRNFKPIIEFCKTADAFQDAPFSFPLLFVALDQAFPNAKFILTVRDSKEQWYSSLIRFHGKVFAEGRVPTKEDLQKSTYLKPGFLWEGNRLLYSTPEDDIYNREWFFNFYETHNYTAREYFRHKKNFFEINLGEKGSYEEMCRFLGKKPARENFEWLKKTDA